MTRVGGAAMSGKPMMLTVKATGLRQQTAAMLSDEVRHVLGRAIRLHHERAQVPPETFARRRLLIENAMDRLVFDRYVEPTTEGARLQKRYRPHRDSLYVFLHRDDVEPTNNSSERDLRVHAHSR